MAPADAIPGRRRGGRDRGRLSQSHQRFTRCARHLDERLRCGSESAVAFTSRVRCRVHHGSQCESSDARRGTPDAGRRTPNSTVLCPGIEISAWRAHIVLLGNTGQIDREQYRELQGLLTLLATSESTHGALSLASLPEYRRNHWNRLDSLAAAGLDGFEIVNASPKANELTRAETDTVIAIARSHGRFVAVVSDSHGWGATSMVWNLVRYPGGGRQAPCSAVIEQLRTGFGSVQIIERHRVRPDDWWPTLVTPLGVVWETWRSMSWSLVASWLIWIWVHALIRRRGTAP